MKPPHKKILIAAGVIVLIFLIGGGSKYSYDYHKSEIKKKDSIINASREIQKELTQEIDFNKNEADYYRGLSTQLEQKNIRLYEKLKIKESAIRKRDTSFINNAMRISDGVNRYLKGKDSIR